MFAVTIISPVVTTYINPSAIKHVSSIFNVLETALKKLDVLPSLMGCKMAAEILSSSENINMLNIGVITVATKSRMPTSPTEFLTRMLLAINKSNPSDK